MTGDVVARRSRRSTAVLLLTIGLAVLLVTVEVLLFRSFTESRSTTSMLDGLTNATTVLANAQRESLRLELEIAGIEQASSLQPYRLRRAFLERQLEVLRGHAIDQPALRRELAPLFLTTTRLDSGFAVGRTRSRVQLRRLTAPAARDLSEQIKLIYDTQEHRLYEALSRTVRKREESQRLLVGLGGAAMLIAGAVVLFLRMGITKDFRRAYAELEAEVEERKGLQVRLEHQARTDPLTELDNRHRFREQVDTSLRTGGAAAVIYLDLDYFKVVNDGFGHGAGDDVLQQAAERLRAAVRPGDSVARLGGDEFAVLLRGVDDDQYPREVAERLLETLHQPFVIDGHPIRIGASLGIAVADRDETDAERLIHDADVAMYAVKNDGKGAFRTFDPGMRSETADRGLLHRDLRAAVESWQLELYFQPVVDLRSGVTRGLEALVRWQHPERGLLLPGEFLPAAEQAGLMVELGVHVLEEACIAAASWGRGGDAAPWVSVNLSPVQLHDPELPRHVEQALRTSGLEPHRLVLEISERAVLHDAQRVTLALERLHALGVRIAVDDFGTGYTSLSYFRFLPISVIKIDRSLVLHITGDESGRRLVAAIMRLAAGLELEAIAEGIEDDATLAALREMGCDLGQGFGLSRPVAAGTIPDMLGIVPRTLTAR